MRRLIGDRRGASAVEFALVAPTFLMFVFLILDGARMMFDKQALNELAAAAARYYAINPSTSSSDLQTWVRNRGTTRSQLAMSSATVATDTTCNGQTMAKVTITMPYKKGVLTFLPQSLVPSNLVSIGCFMMPS